MRGSSEAALDCHRQLTEKSPEAAERNAYLKRAPEAGEPVPERRHIPWAME